MKKILITGGGGFIGFNLAKLLTKKHKVTIFDIKNKTSLSKEVLKILKKNKIIYTSKLNNLPKKNFDYIFHLAATLGVKNVNNQPFDTFLNNTLPLVRLLNFYKSDTRLIFFSTSEVYSPLIHSKKTNFPIKEDQDLLISSETINRDAYYLSKIFCEKILQIKNKKFLILRPHNIYGPNMGNSHVIPNLINKLKKTKNKINVFSPNHTRAFCYIDDAINQIIKLSFSEKNYGKVFNIGNQNEEIKIYDLAKKIKKQLNSKAILVKGKNTDGSPFRRVPSMKKTFKNISYKLKTSLDKGISKTIDWYVR